MILIVLPSLRLASSQVGLLLELPTAPSRAAFVEVEAVTEAVVEAVAAKRVHQMVDAKKIPPQVKHQSMGVPPLSMSAWLGQLLAVVP